MFFALIVLIVALSSSISDTCNISFRFLVQYPILFSLSLILSLHL